MRRSTFSLALLIGLSTLASCVSDSGSGNRQDAGAPPSAGDASALPDTGAPGTDSGTDAGPPGPCSITQQFDRADPIGGAANATWFVTSPNEQVAYFANGANDALYAARFSNRTVSAPRTLLTKAISASASVDGNGHSLLAFEPSGDFEIALDWDPAPNNGPLTTEHLVLKDYTHPSLTADGKHLVARSEGPGVNIGDRYLYQFLIVSDRNTKKITTDSAILVLREHASHPTLSPDGLTVVYVSDDINELRYATRGLVTESFLNPQPLAYASDILKGARPHSMSPDLCRLYFTKATGGAFVATRSPK